MSDVEDMDIDDGNHQQPSRDDIERELDEKYPTRPRNHSPTLPFHTLFEDLFNPLRENQQKPTGPAFNRRRLGPKPGVITSPAENRRAIIERYISRWRREVGDDIFPAFRLIIPEKDRDRGMYGLKEKVIAKYLVKIMKIDKNSEDGFNLLHWKLPGANAASKMAGDFAGRCQEVISKRPMRVKVGKMTIGEVNDLLDELAAEPREEKQIPIMERFYKEMNAEELTWLVRVILRQMKVGATEKTFFHLWHPDAEALFNVSSSLRRVCWELYNPNVRLEGEDTGVALMQCFQPQLAQWQSHSFKKIVEKMRPVPEDEEFWIEEKLDGERMQLHMSTDDSVPGGKSFKFWSRKAKDYTYLYGDGFDNKQSALTQFIRDGFADGVENIILDGEMITWDPEQDTIVPFGTLKTAALSEQRNPYDGSGHRPFFRVFDILYLNGVPLTLYTLRDRRKALERSIKPVHRRMELHEYTVGTAPDEIEPLLREVIQRASEGLVIKNPRSAYRLAERNDDWMKVKPEYMAEYGENLDCLIIGGYYGSGRRGGGLSSFMCGLRDSTGGAGTSSNSQTGAPTDKFVSFFKVGGGLSANDYATIRHETEGKWHDWDVRRPPTKYVDVGKGLNKERPDVWIKPADSLVVQVKAAEVTESDDYCCNMTLRFPRFQRLRRDKDWTSALSLQEFLDLRDSIEQKKKERAFEVDDQRKKRRKMNTRSKAMTIAGYHAKDVNAVEQLGTRGNVFEGLTFFIMTDSIDPQHKKSKLELEALVKAHGGKIVQTHTIVEDTICVADKLLVKVASLKKTGKKEIVKPTWIFDCTEQAERDFARGYPQMVVPLEKGRHLFYLPDDFAERYEDNADEYGDSYARDTNLEELKALMEKMDPVEQNRDEAETVTSLFPDHQDMKGSMFQGLVFYFDEAGDGGVSGSDPSPATDSTVTTTTSATVRFGSGVTVESLDGRDSSTITHIVAMPSSDLPRLRKRVAHWKTRKIPRIVRHDWIQKCWEEGTLLDEEAYVAR